MCSALSPGKGTKKLGTQLAERRGRERITANGFQWGQESRGQSPGLLGDPRSHFSEPVFSSVTPSFMSLLE